MEKHDRKIVEYLSTFYHAGFKPKDEFRMGCEYEKFGLMGPNYKPLPYEGEKSIRSILETLSNSYGWDRQVENGRIIALRKGDCFITLEPGGQIELSATPFRKISSCEKSFRNHINELKKVTQVDKQAVVRELKTILDSQKDYPVLI